MKSQRFDRGELAAAAKRFKVLQAARAPIPDDLGDLIQMLLDSHVGAARRRSERDRNIGLAAQLLDGPLCARSRALAREVEILPRARPAPAGTMRAYLQEAQRCDELPSSERQIRNILRDLWKSAPSKFP